MCDWIEKKFINVINKGMLKCGSCLQTEVRRANPNYWDSYKKAKETYKKSYLESERYLNKQKALEEKFNKKSLVGLSLLTIGIILIIIFSL